MNARVTARARGAARRTRPEAWPCHAEDEPQLDAPLPRADPDGPRGASGWEGGGRVEGVGGGGAGGWVEGTNVLLVGSFSS